ncbi:hypothetical protein HCUR_00701 [Holospora curviuscula]|uniref:Uncharacterized protein n=1 Tax=Holospora curviuscula TaxID=1082868 RepID=A0A2S5R9B8_9PROT|nr:hypothetical protein HCUR_00701 [Holospora curviuscula]
MSLTFSIKSEISDAHNIAKKIIVSQMYPNYTAASAFKQRMIMRVK